MSYREYTPHPQLRSYIDAYWTVQTAAHDLPVPERILPDGCVDIIFNLGTAVAVDPQLTMVTGGTYLVGTMTRFSASMRQPATSLLGIRFKPACFTAFYDLSLQTVTDRIIPFNSGLITGATFEPAVLDKLLLDKIKTVPHTLLPVIEDLYHYKGQLSMDRLAKKHFIHNRQLERQFKQQTGITPKAFANLVRYRFALQHIKKYRDGASLQDIAFEYGYYDHAHLSNEIRKYTGLHPSGYHK